MLISSGKTYVLREIKKDFLNFKLGQLVLTRIKPIHKKKKSKKKK
jgi:ribosomal protein S19